jgi:hypothetical protein
MVIASILHSIAPAAGARFRTAAGVAGHGPALAAGAGGGRARRPALASGGRGQRAFLGISATETVFNAGYSRLDLDRHQMADIAGGRPPGVVTLAGLTFAALAFAGTAFRPAAGPDVAVEREAAMARDATTPQPAGSPPQRGTAHTCPRGGAR